MAGWTSWAGEGSTNFVGLFFLQWNWCECPKSGLERWWIPGTWMSPLQSQCCSWWWLWGESRGVSPEVHDHLHCFECVQLQVVKTAPDSQLLNLLSVSRLVTVLNEADQCGVVCKPQELDRGVFRCAFSRWCWGRSAVGREHSPEEQLFDMHFCSLTSCCLSVRRLVIHWQIELGTESWISLVWRSVGMMVLKAELKSTNWILT